MVDRDDLLDGGAEHVAETVRALARQQPSAMVEVLVSDFAGNERHVDTVVRSAPHVFAHNVEVTRRLTPKIRDPRCSYDRSLHVLETAKRLAPSSFTKSSIMVGVGEDHAEVVDTLRDLRSVQVDVVTIGQYLRPSDRHAKVDRYVPPEEFDDYARIGRELGFEYVASGPLVRSSYHAAEAYLAARSGPGAPLRSGHLPVPRDEPSHSGLVPAEALLKRTRPVP
jgi:lipoic acid synthetase